MEVSVGMGLPPSQEITHTHTPLPQGLGYPSSESLTCVVLRCQAPVGRQKGRTPALQNLVQEMRVQCAVHTRPGTPGRPASVRLQGLLEANLTCDLSEACPPNRSSLPGKTASAVWNISKHKKHRLFPSLLGLRLRVSYPRRWCKARGPNRIHAATCATTRPASDTPSWLRPVARRTPTQPRRRQRAHTCAMLSDETTRKPGATQSPAPLWSREAVARHLTRLTARCWRRVS